MSTIHPWSLWSKAAIFPWKREGSCSIPPHPGTPDHSLQQLTLKYYSPLQLLCLRVHEAPSHRRQTARKCEKEVYLWVGYLCTGRNLFPVNHAPFLCGKAVAPKDLICVLPLSKSSPALGLIIKYDLKQETNPKVS